MQLRKPLIAALGAAIALTALAGCSAGGDSTAEPKKSPSASASATTAAYVPPKKDVTCKDGVAKVTHSNAEVTIDGDCATVEVAANNSLITVSGSVEKLSVSGAINAVKAESITSITIAAGSNGNVITSSNEPKIDDKGEQNEINE